MAFVQFYLRSPQDLLTKEDVEIAETDHVFTKGLTYQKVCSFDECNEYVDKASKNRTVKATKMNPESSRSHLVIHVKFEMITVGESKKYGGFYFVGMSLLPSSHFFFVCVFVCVCM